MTSSNLLPDIPSPLTQSSSAALQWPALREHIAGHTFSPLGRAWVIALEPCADLPWIERQHQRTAEIRAFLTRGHTFDFHGLFDPTTLLKKSRIDGSALEGLEIRDLLEVVERVAAWRNLLTASPKESQRNLPVILALSEPLLGHDLSNLLRLLRGKIEPDGSLSDDASPELRRIRRAMERQHRAIEESLRRALRSFSEGGASQDEVITARGERFVIPIKAEFKRKVPGVIHGSSSTGQTVFVEPFDTIEQNNELVRLLDEEQSEIHRILVAMTRSISADAIPIHLGACILAEVESHHARARFAQDLDCIRPTFGLELRLTGARHPLLELRMRRDHRAAGTDPGAPSLTVSSSRVGLPTPSPTPFTLYLEPDSRQLIISGPNTGGKTVALKTTGLLSLMAQSGIPIPAFEATLPLFTGIFADIGDAQSIESNLSSFSAHIVNVNQIAAEANDRSLVLLDELGSATDPEEGAALAVAIAAHFLRTRAWTCITTHLTSLKVYAANNKGVLNAAVGFDQATLTPTYELRMGVPGASAGLNIAARLGLAPAILTEARAQMTPRPPTSEPSSTNFTPNSQPPTPNAPPSAKKSKTSPASACDSKPKAAPSRKPAPKS